MTFSKIGLVLTLFILLKIAVRHGIRGLEVSKKVDKSSILTRNRNGKFDSLMSQQLIDLDMLNFEYWIFVVVFYRQRQWKTIFKIQNSRCPNLWAAKNITAWNEIILRYGILILLGESVFIFQFLNDEIYYYVKQNMTVNFIN